jgi:branched-chain amino acid transport system substrate-binding protein
VGAQGVFTMSDKDHNGTDLRAQVLVEIKDGKWTYVPVD